MSWVPETEQPDPRAENVTAPVPEPPDVVRVMAVPTSTEVMELLMTSGACLAEGRCPVASASGAPNASGTTKSKETKVRRPERFTGQSYGGGMTRHAKFDLRLTLFDALISSGFVWKPQ